MTKLTNLPKMGCKTSRKAGDKTFKIPIKGKVDFEAFRQWRQEHAEEFYPPELLDGGIRR